MKFCENYNFSQNIAKDIKEDFIEIVVDGHWIKKFNNGNILTEFINNVNEYFSQNVLLINISDSINNYCQ